MTDSQNDAPDIPESPLRSVHTDSFAALLQQSGRSVAVTTYQAGYVVLLRHDGQALNTHFRAANRPMGLAVSDSHLAVGAARELVQFENVAEVTDLLEGPRPHDACYLPRKIHVTGDIDIHEMAFGQSSSGVSRFSDLWFVNTRFSCLCSLDDEHSFVPRWRPPFISSLSPQDRCHLNGLAMIDGCDARTSRAAGATTNRAAACSSTSIPAKRSCADCRCPIRRAGTMASYGCWNPATAVSAPLILIQAATKP